MNQAGNSHFFFCVCCSLNKKMSTSGFDDQQRLLEHLCEIEEAAEEVLSNKQEIVDLDRKRCQNREALRALSHLNTGSSEQTEKKCWLAMGNCFFQLPQDKAKNLLQNGTV